jgi:hypothetical protein
MNDNDNSSSGLLIGMCLGLSIGTAVGIAAQNIKTWIPVGLCLGLAPATVFNNRNDSEFDKKE